MRENYTTKLSVYETQVAIGILHQIFEEAIGRKLCLYRVSAPLIVEPSSGLNDDLNGTERKVSFDMKADHIEAEVVQSLAKWKRYALKKYEFSPGEGIYTIMNAIRRDEDLDALHSVYVDQWDWEKILRPGERTVEFLKQTVQDIVDVIADTGEAMKERFEALDFKMERKVSFLTTEELLQLYPDLSPKDRERAYVKEHPTTFLMRIGEKLSNGEKHDGRAPDYDDWTMNGDILCWDEIAEDVIELSSMGIRVDEEAMRRQLKEAGCEERASLPFHKALLSGELPLTIGGGIGQSRLSMFLLQKAHIGEVQVSVWNDATRKYCEERGISLL